MLSSLKFNPDRLLSSVRGDMSTATELANHLVREHGLPFRQAHAIVGEIVRTAVERGSTLQETVLEVMPSVSTRLTGKPLKIDKDQLRNVLDALKTLELTRTEGGANPRLVPRLLLKDSRALKQNLSWILRMRSSLKEADARLRDEVTKNEVEVRR
jgi:argininosuccinate lyase